MSTEPREEHSLPKRKSLLTRDQLRTIFSPDLTTSLIAILLALLVGALLIASMGVNPLVAYRTLLDGALGNKNSIAETLIRAIPLALVGVGVSIGFRAGTFNIGGEGQLFLGAAAATWVGLQFASLPGYVLIPLMILASMLAGGIWAAIAGILKIRFNASELINTIMMNYIAIFFVNFLVHGPMKEPNSPLGQSSHLPDQALLGILMRPTRLHSGIIITIAVVAIAYVLLWHTSWGYQIRACGKNPLAALAAGINVNWIALSAFALSGAFAGIAGFCEAAGVQHRLLENISPGYGYTAIVVALLGQTNPTGVLAAAILFAGLQVGASTMESAIGVPSSIVTIVQYLIVIFIIGRGALGLLRRRISPAKERSE
ncbi:MAG TPA: ABC transporter permease [Anaerolineaceae bacterium]|nr:ABC transporter permease [Anaerolineaceae bacterium]